VRNVATWLFDEEITRTIAKIDAECYFAITLKFFVDEPFKILLNSHEASLLAAFTTPSTAQTAQISSSKSNGEEVRVAANGEEKSLPLLIVKKVHENLAR
jgi:hypothetical protein